ncbi:hypothetical protein VNI00_012278 [Paramarasmius palmivorus]|uniref:Uncharacterized protein n=1 Tax=Paramarasmius palmivorus TaxID=297713 RepID=A0AAW0C8Q9_9AGAR
MPSAIITGSAQGIGKSIARSLAQAGYDVTINDLPSQNDKLEEFAKEIEGIGRKVVIYTGDVSEETDVKKMIATTVEQLGGLDVMVANAAATDLRLLKPISAGWNICLEYHERFCLTMSTLIATVEEWDRVHAVNTRGTFLCYKYAAEQMISQGRVGRIIGACSASGKRGDPNMAAYSVSKFAIRGLTQCAALEYGKHGITVNAYSPGVVKTELIAAHLGTPWMDGSINKYVEVSALGKVAEMTDIAKIVVFLASKESEFITGQTLNVDGGLHVD